LLAKFLFFPSWEGKGVETVMLSKVLNIEIELVGMDQNGQIKSATLWIEGYLMTVDVRTTHSGLWILPS
jgi:hypothetical protein